MCQKNWGVILNVSCKLFYRYLVKNGQRLLGYSKQRVFLPLCGKSLDLAWYVYVNKHVFIRHALKHVFYGMSSSKISHVISSNMFSHGMPISMFSHDMFTRKSGALGSIPGLATFFRFSFRGFKKGIVSYWRKYVHEVLVNRLGKVWLD